MLKLLRNYFTFIFFNLFFGFIILLFLITNLEWNSKIANVIFPFIVFSFSIFSIKYAKKHFEKHQKRKILFSSFISFFVSGIYFVYYIICLTIGFLFFLFSISEEQDKILIQRTFSPDKVYLCETYFYPVGAYASGNGKIRTYSINKFFPIVRKEVYYEYGTHLCFDENDRLSIDFVLWKDNNLILINKYNEIIEINISQIDFYITNFFRYVFSKKSNI